MTLVWWRVRSWFCSNCCKRGQWVYQWQVGWYPHCLVDHDPSEVLEGCTGHEGHRSGLQKSQHGAEEGHGRQFGLYMSHPGINVEFSHLPRWWHIPFQGQQLAFSWRPTARASRCHQPVGGGGKGLSKSLTLGCGRYLTGCYKHIDELSLAASSLFLQGEAFDRIHSWMAAHSSEWRLPADPLEVVLVSSCVA